MLIKCHLYLLGPSQKVPVFSKKIKLVLSLKTTCVLELKQLWKASHQNQGSFLVRASQSNFRTVIERGGSPLIGERAWESRQSRLRPFPLRGTPGKALPSFIHAPLYARREGESVPVKPAPRPLPEPGVRPRPPGGCRNALRAPFGRRGWMGSPQRGRRVSASALPLLSTPTALAEASACGRIPRPW